MIGWDRYRAVWLVAMLAFAAATGACRKDAEKAAVPPPATEAGSLSSRLNAMSPDAQVDTLRTLLAADSADAQLQFFAGNAYYARAFGTDPTSTTRSVAHLDSAIAAYQRAVAIDSTMSKAWVNMGLTYQEASRPTDARRAFEAAIDANPNDVLAYCHLGFLSHLHGDLTEALRQYQLALAIDPNSSQAHYNMGLAFAEARMFHEALHEWELVIKHDPESDLGKTAAENVRIIKQYTSKP